MALNDFLPFCPNDTGTNLLSQSDYSIATDRSIGNQPGIASSKLVNRATRQAAWVASQLAQFMATTTGSDVLDNGDSATFQALLKQCLITNIYAPNQQKFLSGSGTYGVSYYFTVTSANATAGAVYTNNGHTFVVSKTIAADTTLLCVSSGLPTTSGTLTKSSGTGDATITFAVAKSPLYIKMRMVGAGGGGGEAGNTVGSGGSDGGDTTFGTSTAGGGKLGFINNGTGGLGGTATLGSGLLGIALAGGQGGGLGTITSGSAGGGDGGSSAFGGNGGGSGGTGGGLPLNGQTNTGGGGGGANGATFGGSGGGAGGYVEALITNPAATYSWAIGAAGTGRTGNGGTGADGGSGCIIVEEYWQ